MIVNGFTIGLLLISLSGCASFIANEITSAKKSNIKGDVSDGVVEQQFCDSNSYCVKAIGLGGADAGHHSLSFKFHIDDNRI